MGEVFDLTLESQSGRMGMHTVTREHPFAVLRGGRVEWLAAELLKPGDEVVNGKAISRVASVAVRVGPTVVYNLEVETAHAYLVGAEAALVHNGQGCGIQAAGGKAAEGVAAKAGAGGKSSFPSADKIADELGVSRDAFHREIKPQIVKDFSAEAKGIGSKNPDIGVNQSGNIVLRNPKTGAEVHTDVPLSSYGAE